MSILRKSLLQPLKTKHEITLKCFNLIIKILWVLVLLRFRGFFFFYFSERTQLSNQKHREMGLCKEIKKDVRLYLTSF